MSSSISLERQAVANGSARRTRGDRVERVRHVAVDVGGTGLTALIHALPALDALAQAYPEARTTLIATSSQADLLRGRPGPWHEVAEIPEDLHDLAAFVGGLGGTRFDLGVQLRATVGSDTSVVGRLGARVTVGPRGSGADAFDRVFDSLSDQHGAMRALEAASLAGAAPVTVDPVLAVSRDDRFRAGSLLRPVAGAARSTRMLALHPGASDPRRRWPTAWFGDVVARAIDAGWIAVVVGGDDDRRLARDLIGEAVGRGADCRGILDLTGRSDPSALVGLLEAADAFVGSNSGPLHLALRCGHDPSYVSAVRGESVWADIEDLVADRPAPLSAPTSDWQDIDDD